MGVDLVLLYDCRPRRAAGAGDADRGTEVILEGVKAHNRAERIAHMAKAKGQDVESIRVKVLRTTSLPPNEADAVEVGYRDFVAQYDAIRPYEIECAGCPANVTGQPFGCSRGFVNYPIPATAEAWLLDRLQPYGTVGGHLLFAGIRDFQLDGRPVAAYRAQGLFESRAASSRRFDGPEGLVITVTADQVFQAIFCAGGPLNPAHVFGLLMWVGALRTDGHPPDADRVQSLLKLPPGDARANAAEFDVGPQSSDPGVLGLQRLFYYLYRGWAIDCPVAVSA